MVKGRRVLLGVTGSIAAYKAVEIARGLVHRPSILILDEPTIGLHPRDTDRLLALLRRLRDSGNTVVVVEHNLELVKAADWVVDLGPGAGVHGGRVVAEGPPATIAAHPDSLTGKYLSGRASIPISTATTSSTS